MARFFALCTLFLAGLAHPGLLMARESLRIQTAMARDQLLDWHNPVLDFDLNLPPGKRAASLTLYADPAQMVPRAGTRLFVSVNRNAAIELAPKPQSFTARIDFPQTQLRTGRNHFRIRFEGADEGLCPQRRDGGWQLDLSRSRFDLANGLRVTSFAELEAWLSVSSWSPGHISIKAATIDRDSLIAFGALITQGIAMRTGRAPQIVPDSSDAELAVAARIDPASPGPVLTLRPGPRPRLVFMGRNSNDILAAARLFAARRLQGDGLRLGPAMLARAPLVQRPGALEGLVQALERPVWNTRAFKGVIRTPHGGKSRLVLDLRRPHWISTKSAVLVDAGAGRVVKKHLRNTRSHLLLNLDNSRASVAHRFSISRQVRPANRAASCPAQRAEAPLHVLDARIESSGYAEARGLARFAIDGAPFTQSRGAGAAVIIPAESPKARRAAWQALGRIALVANTPMTAAWYGSDVAKAPRQTALLVIGSRSALPTSLLASLPKVFAAGAATGPGAQEGQRHFPMPGRRAFAATPIPPGLGVAGWGRHDGQPLLVLSAETDAGFAPAMAAFANGEAMDYFAGRVLRWRGGLVEINAIDPDAGSLWQRGGPPGVLFLMAALALAALWARFWRRTYESAARPVTRSKDSLA